jgi:hypothetical protein
MGMATGRCAGAHRVGTLDAERYRELKSMTRDVIGSMAP